MASLILRTSKRAITTSCLLLAKKPAASSRKDARTCNPDFTRCRGAAPLEAEEDPILGPDEDYPEWLWELADSYNMPIDEHLKKPDHALFQKISQTRKHMNMTVMKLRNQNPTLYTCLEYPTEEEVIDHIRNYENERMENKLEGEKFAVDLRAKAAKEIGLGKKSETGETDSLQEANS